MVSIKTVDELNAQINAQVEDDQLEPEEAGFWYGYELDAQKAFEGEI